MHLPQKWDPTGFGQPNGAPKSDFLSLTFGTRWTRDSESEPRARVEAKAFPPRKSRSARTMRMARTSGFRGSGTPRVDGFLVDPQNGEPLEKRHLRCAWVPFGFHQKVQEATCNLDPGQRTNSALPYQSIVRCPKRTSSLCLLVRTPDCRMVPYPASRPFLPNGA